MTLPSHHGTKLSKRAKSRRSNAGRPVAGELEIRKARIIEAASKLFIEYGFTETALIDVAKHAGVATRTIYQHFGYKADVFKAVIELRLEETEQELPEVDESLSVFDVLMLTSRYICALAFSGAAIPYQRLMIAESRRFPEIMQQLFESLHHRLHFNVTRVFETLAKSGKIPDGDHSESTKFFIDLLLGAAPMQLNMNWIKSTPSENELGKKIDLFIAGRFGLSEECDK